jgi:hypothetical protein
MRVIMPVLAAALLLAGREASATTVTWEILLEGSQETPPNATTAWGSAVLSYDTDTNQLSYDISFFGLSSAELFSHIHGPAARGVPAGILHNLPNGSSKIGSVSVSEGDEASLLAGLWYVNVHSANFPGGEIRGQISGGHAK